jgi:V-type H+-transporting ATPase subunit a
MFGDIGHGGLLFLFGLYLIQNAEEIKKDKENMLNMIIDNKYLFTMMGFFGLYSGFIYNDFLAIPWNLFGSCYVNHDKVAEKIVDCVYPFGMDPKWYSSNNELTYFNSLKMKMAVIIGVAQMSFGVILKGINSIHFGLYIDFIFEFIP